MKPKKDISIVRSSAAELIVDRADADKNNMGLTTWKDAPSRTACSRAILTGWSRGLRSDQISPLQGFSYAGDVFVACHQMWRM